MRPANLLLAALAQSPAFEQLGYIDQYALQLLGMIVLRSPAEQAGVLTQVPMPQGWTQDLEGRPGRRAARALPA